MEQTKRLQPLIGKFIRVKVTHPVGSVFAPGIACAANYGELVGQNPVSHKPEGVFILGLRRPVRNFTGRVIALITSEDGLCYAVAAPKNHRYIVGQIRRALRFAFPGEHYEIQCLYERSCGAVVFRKMRDGQLRFLLIKNRRSANWGFPKGHMENHETPEATARREVLEETGLRIRLLPGFSCHVKYTIFGKVEKSVTIFLGETNDRRTVIQQSEIEDYMWLDYQKALQTLKFDNDRNILRRAHAHLERNEQSHAVQPN